MVAIVKILLRGYFDKVTTNGSVLLTVALGYTVPQRTSVYSEIVASIRSLAMESFWPSVQDAQ